MTIRQSFAVAALATALTAGLASGPAVPQSAPASTQAAASRMPTAIWQRHACPTEDSSNCYWNARTMGNGRGHSFYAVKVGRRVCVLFTATRYARHHNYCTTDRLTS